MQESSESRKQEILEKVIEIANLIQQGNEKQKVSIENINYYETFEFKGSGLSEKNLLVAKIRNEINDEVTYEIYSINSNCLIATVNEKGKIQFRAQYIESLKQINEKYVQMLNFEDLDFKLPQELEENDIVFIKEEIFDLVEVLQDRNISNQSGINQDKDKRAFGIEKNAQENDEKQEDGKEIEGKDLEAKELEAKCANKKKLNKKEEVDSKTGSLPQNILKVRPNSNLYKDHPELEPNLFFRKDQNGIVHAEYIDNDGNIQTSKYFEASTTALRTQTVSLENEGNPVTKQAPYQVMQTKGLNSIDKDIVDIRMIIKIDQYGYLDIEEARQGKSGQWLSHDVEISGRNYNSHEINEATSIKARTAEPDRQLASYQKAENTPLKQDGIQYDEMYLMENAKEIIQGFIDEGYQREEATQIFNYMIGEENLSEEEAKMRVNEEIEKVMEERKRAEKVNEERGKIINSGIMKGNIHKETDLGEERTPWGDAERRMLRSEY